MTPPNGSAMERLLRRDKAIVLTGLLGLTALSWAYLGYLAPRMQMGGMDMTGYRMAMTAVGMVMTPAFQPWTGAEFVFTFAMWAIMMVGMMTPSVAPMILLYAQVGRRAAADGKFFAATGWFAGGYGAAWTGFSLAATSGQWLLDRAAMLTPTMSTAGAVAGGVILIAAGIYQWTPLKERCLTHCQAPLQFIQRHGGFQRYRRGSFRMGLQHGIYCVGCCWALMALLFVGGVMNILWIGAISVLVLAEKCLPAFRLLPRLAGILLVLAGIYVVALP